MMDKIISGGTSSMKEQLRVALEDARRRYKYLSKTPNRDGAAAVRGEVRAYEHALAIFNNAAAQTIR